MDTLHVLEDSDGVGGFVAINQRRVAGAKPYRVVDARSIVGGHRRIISLAVGGGRRNVGRNPDIGDSCRRFVARPAGPSATTGKGTLMVRAQSKRIFYFSREIVSVIHRFWLG